MTDPPEPIVDLARIRTSLHGIAELLLAGPQYAVSGDIRLRAHPGGIATVAEPDLRLEGGDLVGPHGRYPLRGSYAEVGAATGNLANEADGPVVQIGMDTPQVTTTNLVDLLGRLAFDEVVVADAEDGGWWALALVDPRRRGHLVCVPMSTAATGALTRAAFERVGMSVGRGPVLSDVDTVEDAEAVAAVCGKSSEFTALWRGRG